MARCDYCKKQGTNQKTAIRWWNVGKLKTSELDYCSETCKQNIHNFTRAYNKFAPKYVQFALIWLILYIIPFILRAITGNPIYVSVGIPFVVALMGSVLLFAPQGLMRLKHYRRVGIKYSTLFIRITGVLVMVSVLSMLPLF